MYLQNNINIHDNDGQGVKCNLNNAYIFVEEYTT